MNVRNSIAVRFRKQIEGLNALILIQTLCKEDPRDYFGFAVKLWNYYMDTNLIEKELNFNMLNTSVHV